MRLFKKIASIVVALSLCAPIVAMANEEAEEPEGEGISVVYMCDGRELNYTGSIAPDEVIDTENPLDEIMDEVKRMKPAGFEVIESDVYMERADRCIVPCKEIPEEITRDYTVLMMDGDTEISRFEIKNVDLSEGEIPTMEMYREALDHMPDGYEPDAESQAWFDDCTMYVMVNAIEEPVEDTEEPIIVEAIEDIAEPVEEHEECEYTVPKIQMDITSVFESNMMMLNPMFI